MWFQLLLVICLNLSQAISDVPYSRVVRQALYGILLRLGAACLTTKKTCTTPDNKVGICTPLKSCQYLFQLMVNDGRNPTTANFLRKSQCERMFKDGMPVVCCANADSTTRPSATTRPTSGQTTGPKQESVNYGTCGKTSKNEVRIVGGRNATLGEWPWMVALGYRSSSRPNLDFKCGATLISNKWVITAAHCVKNLGNFQLTTARLGDLDLDPNVVDNATVVDEPIDEIIPHPEYSSSPITNDIALLRLKNTVKFTVFIRPVCLLSGEEYRSETFYNRKRPFIMGWGAVEWRGSSSSLLQVATLAIVNQTHCASAYAQQRSAKIDHRVLCAGEKGKDTCQGDSGGPLIFPIKYNDNKGLTYFLGGVVSFGVRCADLTYPGVYTRIAAFTDWISQTTGLQLD